MFSRRTAELILEAYSLEDILTENDLTEEDVLLFLVEQEFLSLPEHLPLGD